MYNVETCLRGARVTLHIQPMDLSYLSCDDCTTCLRLVYDNVRLRLDGRRL